MIQFIWISVLFITFLLSSRYYLYSLDVDSIGSIENAYSSLGERRELVPAEQLEVLQTHVKYAAAAYCMKSEVVNWTCGSRCAGEITVEDFFHDGVKGAYGYIAYSKANKSIIVCFRGSRDFMNWVYDLRFAFLDYKFPGVEGALVHSGFYETYDRVKSSILWTIQWMMVRKENSCRGYDIIITGHSLGGALASFLAIDVKRYILDPILENRTSGEPFAIHLTTIGEPRVGNDLFVEIIQNQLVFNKVHVVSRITHRNDMIVHLPPYDRGFRHHPHEIWVKEQNRTYICEDIVEGKPIEDPSCHAGVPFFDFSVHMFVWDIKFTPTCA